MTIEWKLELRKLTTLKPFAKNPRKMTAEEADHLTKSIQKFGLIDKPILNSDGTIIAGHQRIQILKKQKVKEVECWVPSNPLSDNDIAELNVRHNKNTGQWDWEILANDFEIADLVSWGFRLDELHLDLEEDEDEEENCHPPTDCENSTFTISIPNEDAASFQNQLTGLLFKFPRAELKVKNG